MTNEQFYNAAAAYMNLKEGDTKHREIINIYNSITPLPRGTKANLNMSWCAIFQSAIAKKLGFSANVFPYEMSCYYMYEWAKDRNKWKTAANVGYLIIYDWKTTASHYDHVGYIYNMTDNYIDVIEGNKNNTVGVRRVRKNNSEIMGYIDIGITNIVNTSNVNNEELERVARAVIRGKYGNGATRKTKLESLGYNYNDVQALVNKIMYS